MTQLMYSAHIDMVQAQLCSEWPKLQYWSPVQIFSYHQIDDLRQNPYVNFSIRVGLTCKQTVHSQKFLQMLCYCLQDLHYQLRYGKRNMDSKN